MHTNFDIIEIIIYWFFCNLCSQKQDSATLDMERANKEIEMLRKQYEAMSQELKEATQEAEVAKCRRDWAFQERDKIVAERESIRSVCTFKPFFIYLILNIRHYQWGFHTHYIILICTYSFTSCPICSLFLSSELCVITCGEKGTGPSATWPMPCVIWTIWGNRRTMRCENSKN